MAVCVDCHETSMGIVHGIVVRLAAWFGRLSSLIKAVVLLVAMVLVGGGVYAGFAMYDYTEHNPEFCRSCHTMEYAWDRWETSEHRKVECHECHVESVSTRAELVSKYMLSRPELVSAHASVPNDRCAKCHENGDKDKWIQVSETAGHKVHVEQQDIGCVTCHGASLHRFAPPKEVCQQCHKEKTVLMAPMANQHCLTCHNYLREADKLDPQRETCLTCHAKHEQVGNKKVNWPADAPMRFACQQCHMPHDQTNVVVDCLSCHQKVKTAGLHQSATHSKTACVTCHSAHEWKTTKRETCQACHKDKSGHNPTTFCGSCHRFKPLVQ